MIMASVIDDLTKISIITPFYNPGEFLSACIESIIAQTYPNWELILVNDFSTDNSLEIAESFARTDQRIKLFQNANKGLISALRMAHKQSTSNYITRMDADDIMQPNRLKLMVEKLQSSGVGHVCIGKVKYFSENELGEGYRKYESWLNELTEKEENFKGIYRECSIPSPNFLIHRTDFESIGGFDHDNYPEDYDLAFRMYQHGLKVCSINETTLHWRDHSTRSTRTQDHYQPLSFIPLKVKYFLSIDYDSTKELVLWGAGKKGKLIARELIKHAINFMWITDNKKKAGKDIYGVVLEDSTNKILSGSLVILGVSNPEEVNEITSKLSQVDYYRFF